jgi:hypothetical protein
MPGLSNYLQNKLIDRLFRGQPYTFLSPLYVGLFTNTPTPAGGTEVTGGSYARSAIASSLVNWSGTQAAGSVLASSGTTGTTSNNANIFFPSPTTNWGTVTHFGVFDDLVGGNLLFYGSLNLPRTIQTGDLITFPANSLVIQVV